jgi:hypothetical protein
MEKEKNEFPIFNNDPAKITIETINRGKECWYKDKRHYLVYEADNFKLISKNKDLSKVFSVPVNQVSYVRKKG